MPADPAKDDPLGSALLKLAGRTDTPPVVRDWLLALSRGDDGGPTTSRKKGSRKGQTRKAGPATA